jgi:type I restriction enzyme R subunit
MLLRDELEAKLRQLERQLAKFPNARVNPEEQRQLRGALCVPLLEVGASERTRIVELIVSIVTR